MYAEELKYRLSWKLVANSFLKKDKQTNKLKADV